MIQQIEVFWQFASSFAYQSMKKTNGLKKLWGFFAAGELTAPYRVFPWAFSRFLNALESFIQESMLCNGQPRRK